MQTPDNDKKLLEISCNPLKDAGGNNHLLVVIHDISVHKQLEKEREDVIGFVAHELRNPLSNLLLCNELLREAIKSNDEDLLNDTMARSKNNLMRLNKMITELYDATRVSSGNMALDISSFNFIKMIKEAVADMQALHPSYNIIVNGNADITVNGDCYRLAQVITNYISNGIKYSNGKTTITLNVQRFQEHVVISVKDEGLGIAANQLPYIFDRFFRAEKTRNLEGLGLGLFLCRQIIHAHGGQVWAESQENKGATFFFSIPI